MGGWGVGRVFALFGEQCVGASVEVSICWEINEIPYIFETCVCVCVPNPPYQPLGWSYYQ